MTTTIFVIVPASPDPLFATEAETAVPM
jgi:hypothetical protein